MCLCSSCRNDTKSFWTFQISFAKCYKSRQKVVKLDRCLYICEMTQISLNINTLKNYGVLNKCYFSLNDWLYDTYGLEEGVTFALDFQFITTYELTLPIPFKLTEITKSNPAQNLTIQHDGSPVNIGDEFEQFDVIEISADATGLVLFKGTPL